MKRKYFIYLDGKKVFSGGKEDWEKAREAAQDCDKFILDVEDEIIADDLRSCYNCRYRRWTAEGFTCQQNK